MDVSGRPGALNNLTQAVTSHLKLNFELCAEPARAPREKSPACAARRDRCQAAQATVVVVLGDSETRTTITN